MSKRVVALSTLAILIAAGSGRARAQSFYAGKTIRLVVGFAPGGGFDTYARVFARHTGRHVPGNPTLVVENMTGAGGLIAANYLYRIAKPDGLTVEHFNGALFLGQALGQPGIEFDARKFELIGAPIKEDAVCALTGASGITSIEKWVAARTPVKLGGGAPGGTPDANARILKAALGLPIQLVSGYKGTAEIRLAASSGEVAGACWSWESMRSTWRGALDSGEVVAVAPDERARVSRPAGRPARAQPGQDRRSPSADQGRHPERGAFARPLALPPGTPKDRVLILRRAFQETLKDPAFLAEAEKAKLTLEPATAEELERMVAEAFALEPALLAKLQDILYK